MIKGNKKGSTLLASYKQPANKNDEAMCFNEVQQALNLIEIEVFLVE